MSPQSQPSPADILRSVLETHPEVLRLAQARAELSEDPHRPIYHFVSPEGKLNDPNGLCHWQGYWHLFYQACPFDSETIYWAHAISKDLCHWKDLPPAICPDVEKACWSGSALVESDRVIAIYYGLERGAMIALAKDPLLMEWNKLSSEAVIPLPCPTWQYTNGKEKMNGVGGNPVPPEALNMVYDPCIWKKGSHYYALSGGATRQQSTGRRVRAHFLFRSEDLKHWDYLHPFVEGDVFGYPDDDGACPYFWPLGDQYMLLGYGHRSGGYYLIGHYDEARDKFVVEDGGDLTFGPDSPSGLKAPSATPDGKGGIIAIFNVAPGKPCVGWDQIMTLPRRFALSKSGALSIEPAGDIQSLRESRQSIPPRDLPANEEILLNGIEGNAIEIVAEIDCGEARSVELTVLRSPDREEFTRIEILPSAGRFDWKRAKDWEDVQETRDSILILDGTRSSQLSEVESCAPRIVPVHVDPKENWQLRVFVDRSVVEVFINKRQCACIRVYPGRADSTGVSLRAQGQRARLQAMEVYTMKNIYSEEADSLYR